MEPTINGTGTKISQPDPQNLLLNLRCPSFDPYHPIPTWTCLHRLQSVNRPLCPITLFLNAAWQSLQLPSLLLSSEKPSIRIPDRKSSCPYCLNHKNISCSFHFLSSNFTMAVQTTKAKAPLKLGCGALPAEQGANYEAKTQKHKKRLMTQPHASANILLIILIFSHFTSLAT